MQLTLEQYNAICKAIELLPKGKRFNALPEEKQYIISKADTELLNIYNRYKKEKRRTADYIAEKRKTDKNYARPKKA